MKSPIKDSTRKFNCLPLLKKIIKEKSVIHSFLFYGGEVEFNLSEHNRFICAHTNKFVIYEFWKYALEDPHKIHEIVTSDIFKFDGDNMFNILQEHWPTYKDPYVRSSLFFLLNRCSSAGLVSSGKLDIKNFNPIALSYLRSFNPSNFHLIFDEGIDFLDSIQHLKEADYLLFPIGKFNFNLMDYGKSQGYESTLVNHRKLCEILKTAPQNWILLYEFHPALLSLYKDYNIFRLNKNGKRIEVNDGCQELVITNFKITEMK